MAVEIREIGIRMRVTDAQCPAPPGGEGNANEDLSDHDRAMIVDECVRRVVAMLRNQTER